MGAPAPGSYAEFGALSAVVDAKGGERAEAMIEDLLGDQATVVEGAKAVVAYAEAASDQATADLATRRIDVHEKNAWMLRSHLE